MFCFLEESVRLFGSLKSYYEAIEVVDAEFLCISSKLSKDVGIITFLSNFPKRDAVTITISGVSDSELSISNQSIWVDQFQAFLSSNDDDDEITIKIHIDKSTADNKVSVYCYEKIVDYIVGLSTKKQLNLFAKVLQKNIPYFRFDVFDTNADLFSEYIAFCNIDVKWPTVSKSRVSKIKMCEEASAFLNRFELSLIPQDFCLTNQQEVGTSFQPS